MALRQTAHEVEARQTAPASVERILIHVTESPATAGLIRRGKRVADYLKADCFAVGVLPSSNREAIERHLDFARQLHIETRVLEGEDPADTLVDFARRNGVTQIFLAKPPKRKLLTWGKRDIVMKVVVWPGICRSRWLRTGGGRLKRAPRSAASESRSYSKYWYLQNFS